MFSGTTCTIVPSTIDVLESLLCVKLNLCVYYGKPYTLPRLSIRKYILFNGYRLPQSYLFKVTIPPFIEISVCILQPSSCLFNAVV